MELARHKTADKATKSLKEQSRRRVAARTYAALQHFEDRLATTQAAQADVDDLPIDADSTKMRKTFAPWDGTSTLKDSKVARSATLPALDATLEKHERDPCARRPPSPLGLYDYGAISSKPRSLFAQQRVARDKALRPKHRETSCGFYFPGPQLRQGPYGFSMLDPIHMAPTSWQVPHAPPDRWGDDAVDVRPATLDQIGKKRITQDMSVIPDAVRCNGAHERRAVAVFKCLDRHRDDMILERRRFENGVFEGRWRLPGRDPTLDRTAGVVVEPDEEQGIDTEWVGLPDDELSEPRRLASCILFGLDTALTKNRAKLSHLFKGVEKSAPGTLEPSEFLKGLIRLGIVQSDEVGPGAIIEAMSEVDSNFNGRVEFPTLERAIQAARLVRRRQAEAEHLHRKQQHKIIAQSYSESLPVEVIKVDRDSRSLVIFQRSFEKFRKQQRDLLVQHNEQPQPM
eukprot:CAMPEP_0178389586 /NCGR_PEP_ID=MMETSP0689_2-20121128/10199_1 /TAXON_ID=160604 /ORGANISM="Amphidinium massartii, Strain CS-259" /LENGTH=455 /DNA_ID=CAMNT_0020010053 /DNA_START=67 /DNA_END=1434 /DNA_ORIENTATION=-